MLSFEFKADVINLVTPRTSSKLGPGPIIVNYLQGVTSSSPRVTQLRHAGSVTMVTWSLVTILTRSCLCDLVVCREGLTISPGCHVSRVTRIVTAWHSWQCEILAGNLRNTLNITTPPRLSRPGSLRAAALTWTCDHVSLWGTGQHQRGAVQVSNARWWSDSTRETSLETQEYSEFKQPPSEVRSYHLIGVMFPAGCVTTFAHDHEICNYQWDPAGDYRLQSTDLSVGSMSRDANTKHKWNINVANKILYSILEKSYIMNNKYNFRYCYLTLYLIMMTHSKRLTK